MHADEPGLFDAPEHDRPSAPQRTVRGANRQKWSRTVAADITIVDAAAVREAAKRALEDSISIRLGTDADETESPSVDHETDVFDALWWLIWPSEDLESALDAGALRILSEEIQVAAESPGWGTVTWTVTVKLTDVDELRRLAAEACPDEAEMVADSLAVAWRHAADPFLPIRSIPGITWRPVRVDIEHLPTRPPRNR